MIERNGSAPGTLRLLGIGGSTRRGSLSLLALEAALRLAEEAGATTRLADVRTLDLPLYDEDRPLAAHPSTLARLLDDVRAVDAVLLCSPTYHGTIAGGLKNVLDALGFLAGGAAPYFGGKPVGLMALGGPGAMNAITSMTHATLALNGLAVPTVVTVPRGALDPATGALRDEAIERRLRRMIGEVIELGRRLRDPGATSAVPLAEVVGAR